MFSKACEYAIKIMIYLAEAEQANRRTGLHEITKAVKSPEAFTAKILQQLVKYRLLSSFKGPSGGYQLIKDKQVILIDIVKAVDGDKLLEECVLGFDVCSGENPCPVHHRFVGIRDQLKDTLLSFEIGDKNLLG